MQTLMNYLPFEHIAYTPLRIYLGKIDGIEIGRVLGIQFFWVAVLFAAGHWFWNAMSRKITIHGG
jgi:ABC-2 type transport system permease protein